MIAVTGACDSDPDARDLINRVTVASNNFDGIRIDTDNTIVKVDGKQQLRMFAVSGADSSADSLSDSAVWSSSDNNVATVDGLGVVTGVADGMVTITGRFGPLASAISLQVSSASITSIQIEQPSGNSVNECTSVQLTATGIYAANEGRTRNVTGEVEWTVAASSTTGYFSSFDAPGLLRNSDAGSVTVTATYSQADIQDSVEINVLDNLDRIEIPVSDTELTVSNSVNLTALATFSSGSDGSSADITDNANWVSGDTVRAEVDNDLPSKGLVDAKANGRVVLTAQCGGQEGRLAVLVGDADRVTGIKFSQTSPLRLDFDSLDAGEPIVLRSIATLENQTEVDVTEDSTWTLLTTGTNAQLSNSEGTKGELTVRSSGKYEIQVEYTGDTYTLGVFNIPTLTVDVQ